MGGTIYIYTYEHANKISVPFDVFRSAEKMDVYDIVNVLFTIMHSAWLPLFRIPLL